MEVLSGHTHLERKKLTSLLEYIKIMILLCKNK